MTTAHAPEGVTPSSAPEQGTEAAVKTAEHANVAENTEEKLDVSDLKARVEDPTVGDADELRDFTADEVKKDEAVESGAGSFKTPESDAVTPEQIKDAQGAIDEMQAKNPLTPQGNIEDLLGNLKLKAAPPQDRVADERPPRYFPPPQEHADERPPRQFPLDRRNRDERRGKHRNDWHGRLDEMDERVKARRQESVVPVVASVVAAPAPVVVPPQVQTPKPSVAQPPAAVQNVTPVPPPEDTEVAALQAQAARSNAPQSSKRFSRWSPETERNVGYGLLAVFAVLLGIWGLSYLFGDSKKTDVPNVPVEEVARVTPPAPTAANQVLLDKLQQMDNRLAEALPSQADLAFLDSKITEAENAGVSQLERIPCFKDPNQERCLKAVNAERVYYDSDFSHPRDVALGKIPYKKTTDKPAPKKASKKVTKK